MNKAVATCIAAAVILVLAGCASATGQEKTGSLSSASENPYGEFAVDAPAPDETILTVIGPNETDDYSMADLRALVTEPVKLMEPFVKTQQTFIGVPLETLFNAAGIKGTDKVSTIALNEYVFDDLANNFTSSKGLLAINRDDADIPMDQGGPIRIVFPSGTKYFSFLDAWNWSLRTIEVVK